MSIKKLKKAAQEAGVCVCDCKMEMLESKYIAKRIIITRKAEGKERQDAYNMR